MSHTVEDESRVLRVLLVCPDQDLYQSFKASARQVPGIELAGEAVEYFDPAKLTERVSQFRADSIFVDLASDGSRAMSLIERCSDQLPQVSIAGIHRTNDPEMILNCLRSGASEFLHSPFANDDVSAAVGRMLRRKLVDRRSSSALRGRILAFAPVKGGAGATTLACNVACQLQKESKGRVLLADCALRAGVIAFLLRLRTNYTVLDAIKHSSRLDPALWASLVVAHHGVDVLAAPDRPEPLIVEPYPVQEIFEYARTAYDHIIIDLSSVCDPLSMAALTSADDIYTVCSSEMSSLYMMRGTIPMLEELGHPRDRINVVVNRYDARNGLSTDDMEKIFRAKVFRTFPNDSAAVESALREGVTVPSNTELGRSIRDFVRTLAGTTAKETTKGFGIGSLKVLLGG